MDRKPNSDMIGSLSSSLQRSWPSDNNLLQSMGREQQSLEAKKSMSNLLRKASMLCVTGGAIEPSQKALVKDLLLSNDQRVRTALENSDTDKGATLNQYLKEVTAKDEKSKILSAWQQKVNNTKPAASVIHSFADVGDKVVHDEDIDGESDDAIVDKKQSVNPLQQRGLGSKRNRPPSMKKLVSFRDQNRQRTTTEDQMQNLLRQAQPATQETNQPTSQLNPSETNTPSQLPLNVSSQEQLLLLQQLQQQQNDYQALQQQMLQQQMLQGMSPNIQQQYMNQLLRSSIMSQPNPFMNPNMSQHNQVGFGKNQLGMGGNANNVQMGGNPIRLNAALSGQNFGQSPHVGPILPNSTSTNEQQLYGMKSPLIQGNKPTSLDPTSTYAPGLNPNTLNQNQIWQYNQMTQNAATGMSNPAQGGIGVQLLIRTREQERETQRLQRLDARRVKKSKRERERRMVLNGLYDSLGALLFENNEHETKDRASILQATIIFLNTECGIPLPVKGSKTDENGMPSVIDYCTEKGCENSVATGKSFCYMHIDGSINTANLTADEKVAQRRGKKSLREKQRRHNVNVLSERVGEMLQVTEIKDKRNVLNHAIEYVTKMKNKWKADASENVVGGANSANNPISQTVQQGLSNLSKLVPDSKERTVV